MTTLVKAWGAPAPGAPFVPLSIPRRAPGPLDVVIDIEFCGVCHSDIHQVRDEWGPGRYPMVPGHEIIGRVVAVGASVTKLAVGDRAGVGCLVDSCRTCAECERDLEQFCLKGAAQTYNHTEMDRVTPTYGGYSARIVVPERFALRVPDNLDPAGAAPLLCAGITTWSPLRRFGCGPGKRVGVVGLGGLGHMAVKLAASLGAEVTVLSHSAAKEADARRLGATRFVVSTDAAAMKALAGTFDLLVDTVSAPHEYDPYLRLLRAHGTMALVGAPPGTTALRPFALLGGGKQLAGSMIGGLAETQELLDHCGRHGIVSDVEVIGVRDVDAAYERVLRSDVRYRFVIDLSTLAAT